MRPTLTPPVSAEDHSQGSANAHVTLVEYGDFECPHCGRAYPIVEAVRREFGDTLLLVFRHFPLSEVHAHAEMAAEAAEAAGAQGRFWAMHQMLFQHQNALDMAHLLQYASSIGVEVDQFREDLSTRRFRKRVRENFLGGARSGVNGTPTFFINGVRYDGPLTLEHLAAAIKDVSPVRD